MKKFVIKCNHRKLYFVAIHGFTPFYSTIEKAISFTTFCKAQDYALQELFQDETGFTIEEI